MIPAPIPDDDDGDAYPSDACVAAILRRFDELTDAAFLQLAAESGLPLATVTGILFEAGSIGPAPDETVQ